ncbi:MAG: hypothetical protein FWB96_01015 [Defluviitaleaceae bacterium]|nr:hypothetical protein [Defluviitaleaceae bacterium]MCL2262385.1 hypothetical protein [Defluviitaleaceae bacterium]
MKKAERRLTIVLSAVMFVFLVGTAYALASGNLALMGTVVIEPRLTLEWVDYSVTGEGNRIESSADGQSLSFWLTFAGIGDTTTITAAMENTGAVPVITAGSWSDNLQSAINAALPYGFEVEAIIGVYTNMFVDPGMISPPQNTVIKLTSVCAAHDHEAEPINAQFSITLDYTAG